MQLFKTQNQKITPIYENMLGKSVELLTIQDLRKHLTKGSVIKINDEVKYNIMNVNHGMVYTYDETKLVLPYQVLLSHIKKHKSATVSILNS